MPFKLTDQDRQEIVAEYKAGTTIQSIADAYGVTRRTVYDTLQGAGVQRRRRPGCKRQDFAAEDLDRMARLRRQGLSKEELQDEFSSGMDRINRALSQLGLAGRMPRRDAKDRLITHHGYAYVLVAPDDPMISMVGHRSKYVLEHRLVMARSLGRPLRDDETVHHINGVRDDNCLENLQLRIGKHGNGVVMTCNSCGSHDISAKEIAD
jgi:transposase-like protein